MSPGLSFFTKRKRSGNDSVNEGPLEITSSKGVWVVSLSLISIQSSPSLVACEIAKSTTSAVRKIPNATTRCRHTGPCHLLCGFLQQRRGDATLDCIQVDHDNDTISSAVLDLLLVDVTIEHLSLLISSDACSTNIFQTRHVWSITYRIKARSSKTTTTTSLITMLYVSRTRNFISALDVFKLPTRIRDRGR